MAAEKKVVRKRGPSVKKQLLHKSREAALTAVQIFNNPLTTFKTETFIVLINIAWTYLLHSYYQREKVEYRYYEQRGKRRKFAHGKSGAYRYWELNKCLDSRDCPLDSPTKNNLKFLIDLRNEIVHHQSAGVDVRLSGRYLACCLNYERYICELFGEQYSLGNEVAFTLQFRDLTTPTSEEAAAPLPSNVANYIREFDSELSDEDMKSPHFRRRFIFTPVVTNSRKQSDEVIKFVPFDSDLGKEINAKYALLKETEQTKYLPKQIVTKMNEEGYTSFTIPLHTRLWQKLDGKNSGKGYGVLVAGRDWYWYERWVNLVRKHCKENNL